MIVSVFDFRLNRSSAMYAAAPNGRIRPACSAIHSHLKGEMAMTKQENINPQETTSEIKVEDLPVDESGESEVKGGMESIKKAWKDATPY